MKASTYQQTAAVAAFGAAITGLLYSIAFVVLRNTLLSALCLMAGGLLAVVVMVALFERLGEVDAQPAMLGLVFGTVAALGSAIHGGYDLANALNPPGTLPEGIANLPSPIDPRGLLTFGVAGLAVLIAGFLMRRHPQFSSVLTGLTFVLGVLLIVVYLGRLIVLSPASPLVLIPAAITGFIVNPLWYLMVGLTLRRDAVEERMAAPTPAEGTAPVR
jgi:hypothetical protein